MCKIDNEICNFHKRPLPILAHFAHIYITKNSKKSQQKYIFAFCFPCYEQHFTEFFVQVAYFLIFVDPFRHFWGNIQKNSSK